MTIKILKALLFPCFLLLSLNLYAQEGPWLKEVAEKWANSAEYSLKIANSMPEEVYGYRPTDEQRTFGEQVNHLAQNMIWLSETYLDGGKFEGKEGSSKAECIARLEAALAFAEKAIKELETKDLDETVDFFAGPKSIRQILTLMNDHQTHHRAQMIVYLRLKGVKPARYVGW